LSTTFLLFLKNFSQDVWQCEGFEKILLHGFFCKRAGVYDKMKMYIDKHCRQQCTDAWESE